MTFVAVINITNSSFFVLYLFKTDPLYSVVKLCKPLWLGPC